MTGGVRTKRGESRGETPRQALHVLLVEDHRDSAEAIAAVLRMWGHDPQVAGTVSEALDIAERSTGDDGGLDLAICDIGLPDGNGWDLMRQLAGRYGLPGIAVTALSSPLDRERSAAAGFSHHLVKPLNLEELESALELLARDGASEPRAALSAPGERERKGAAGN